MVFHAKRNNVVIGYLLKFNMFNRHKTVILVILCALTGAAAADAGNVSSVLRGYGLLWSSQATSGSIGTAYAADIDNDSFKEVLFGSSDSRLYALDTNGTALWNYASGARITAAP